MSKSDSQPLIPDAVFDEQRRRLAAGECPRIAELLQGTRLAGDREAILDLIYHEIVVRDELGTHAEIADFVRQFPDLRADIELHFEIHAAVCEDFLDTADVRAEDTGQQERGGRGHEGVLPIEDYEIGEALGHGAMADVYRARHRKLNRDVALKVFRFGALLTQRHAARIRLEAEAIARLSHPHIIQIYEVGECDGAPFLSLELAEQGTLAQRLQKFPLAAATAARLIAALARAVQHAHERHVVHRDLKPANVLFTSSGVAKISDFGLAKVLREDELAAADVTRTGETMGTPRYMAPEQAAGDQTQIGPATDIYALGTLLYECLTGRAPFVAAGVAETLQMILQEEPASPRRWQPAIPRDLETICLQCLQKQPERRYASAADLADDLQRFLRGEPIKARRTPRWERVWKWSRRKPAHAALVAWGVVACLSTLSAAIILPYLEERRVDGLRQEVSQLMADGHALLARDEVEPAEGKFRSAWLLVRGEAALADHATSVTGWLDHTRHVSSHSQWQLRVPPRNFEDRRNEALLLSLLQMPHVENPVPVARRAIQEALAFTLEDDPQWSAARTQLHILDIEIIAHDRGSQEALTALDAHISTPSRRLYQVRAGLLDELGRADEAVEARSAAQGLAGDATEEAISLALDFGRNRRFEEAAAAFADVTRRSPEHFAARLLQAVCCLQLHRTREARALLTACIAQRPYFSWTYYFRSLAESADGNHELAIDDLTRALETRPSAAARYAASIGLAEAYAAQDRPLEVHAAFLQAVRAMPNEPLVYCELAVQDLEAGQWGSFVCDMQSAVEHESRCARAIGASLLNSVRAGVFPACGGMIPAAGRTTESDQGRVAAAGGRADSEN